MAVSEAAGRTLDKISVEFETEVMAELEDGRSQALAQIEAARRETTEAVSKLLETSVKQAESLKRQMVGSAELESRNLQLKALEEAVNEVFESANRRVTKVPPGEYEEALSRLIREGTEVIGTAATVACNSADQKTVSSLLRKFNRASMKLSLAEKSIHTIGGVVLATPDGTVRFDNTFEARLERTRPTLRKDVATILSGAQ